MELCYALKHKDILEQNNLWVGTHTFVVLKRPCRNCKKTMLKKVSGSRWKWQQSLSVHVILVRLVSSHRVSLYRKAKQNSESISERALLSGSLHTHGICPDMLLYLLIYFVWKLLLWFNNNYGHWSLYIVHCSNNLIQLKPFVSYHQGSPLLHPLHS